MAYNLAIVGYGGMGSWHHRNIQDHVPEIQVTGAYDVREEARTLAAANGLKVYDSLEALLADKTLDIITVAVPNNFHRDISIAAMRRGKNVICEKPVAMNARELEEIIAVRDETGRLFSIHQNRRWDKDYRTIKQILADQTIGTPYFIESRVQGSRRSLHGWRGHKVNGGGMVLDWGVHLLDQLLDLIDSKVTQVYGQLFSIFSDEVDDNFKAVIRFENGVSAMMEIATNCFITQPRWHMSCTDGTVQIDGWGSEGKMIRLLTDYDMGCEDEIVYTAAVPTRTMAPRPVHTTQELELPDVPAEWSSYYKNIAGVLDGREDLIVKPEQALRVMKGIDLIFQSNEKGVGLACRI